jgi:hypothetical protein
MARPLCVEDRPGPSGQPSLIPAHAGEPPQALSGHAVLQRTIIWRGRMVVPSGVPAQAPKCHRSVLDQKRNAHLLSLRLHARSGPGTECSATNQDGIGHLDCHRTTEPNTVSDARDLYPPGSGRTMAGDGPTDFAAVLPKLHRTIADGETALCCSAVRPRHNGEPRMATLQRLDDLSLVCRDFSQGPQHRRPVESVVR